jgi:hypothetical protein
MAATLIPLFNRQSARVLQSSLSTGAGTPRPAFAASLSAFGGGVPSQASAPPSGGGAMLVDGGASSAPSDAPTGGGGVLAQAQAFVAQNKTAVAIAGGVAVVAIGAGLFLAFRKG